MEIGGKDFTASDARSRLREIKGRDPQSIRLKYAFAWKIMTQPMTRLMLSDNFMEAWHDRTFPKLINPYRFRRMEKELTIDKNYHHKYSDLMAENGRYQKLLKEFMHLSEELI